MQINLEILINNYDLKLKFILTSEYIYVNFEVETKHECNWKQNTKKMCFDKHRKI